jgi:anti-anti-sigma factor
VEITHRVLSDVVVVAPTGRLDYIAAGDFERSLMPLLDPASGSRAGVVVDLGGVDYISSVGLRVLMIATKAVRGRGARFAVAGMQQTVKEIFAISRFNGVVEIFGTVDEALTALSPTAAALYRADRPARKP